MLLWNYYKNIAKERNKMGRYSNDNTSEPAFRHIAFEDRIVIEAGLKYGATKKN